MKLNIKNRATSAFTVVELIIVIAVIAILATVTIVAYNGIQQNAHKSALMSDLDNSAAIMAHDINANGSYAATVTAADGGNGLPTNSGTTYQYAVNNSATPPTFCLTGTNSNISYYINSNIDTPTKGGCPGDGQGGVAAITNLVYNPSFTTVSSFFLSGVGVPTTTTSWSTSGSTSIRAVSDGTTSDSYIMANGYDNSMNIKPNTTYTLSVYGKVVVPGSGTGPGINGSMQATMWWHDGSAYRIVKGTQLSNVAGTIGRSWITFTTPATVWQAFIRLYTGYTSGEVLWDSAMLTEGSTLYTYADGSSANWIWNGAPNASTSTGPVL